MSPCISATPLPPSYYQHRAAMSGINLQHTNLNTLINKYGCTEITTFSGLCHDKFPSIRFSKNDTDTLMTLERSLINHNKELRNSHEPLQNLIRGYQRYEKLMKKAYSQTQRVESSQLPAVLEEIKNVEKLLIEYEAEAKQVVSRLSTSFNGFILAFATLLSGREVINEGEAYAIYSEAIRANPPRPRTMPATFVGMSYEYKALIDNQRQMKGNRWLDNLMKAYLENHNYSTDGAWNIPIVSLSAWANSVDENFENVPVHIQNAVLGLKERVGCWEQQDVIDQRNRGQSLEAYLRFHSKIEGNINFPFVEKIVLSQDLQNKHNRLNNNTTAVKTWLRAVNRFFDPHTGWVKGADILMKEEAVLIRCLGLNIPDLALKEEAINKAKMIVSHIYSNELIIDLQQ